MIDSDKDESNILFQQQQQVDDLADYQEYQQEKIVQQIMGLHSQTDDLNHLQNILKDKVKESPQKKKLNNQQMKMKQIRLNNAKKYFQMVKARYLLHLARSIKEVKFIKEEYDQIIARFLSGLNYHFCQQLFQLKSTKPISLELKSVLNFIKKAILELTQKGILQQMEPHIIFWSVCQYLQLPCRKICFFDLQNLAQQSFYKLNYEDNSKKERKQRKINKQHQKIKMQLHLKIQEQKQNSSKEYMFLQDYQFDENSFKSISAKSKPQKIRKSKQKINQNQDSIQFSEIQKQYSQVDTKLRRENNFLRNKNYKKCYFQLFSVPEGQWKTINAQILQIQDLNQLKKYVLNGKCIVGFYSMRLLHCRDDQAKQLIELNDFSNICIEDVSMYFYDNRAKLYMRKNRVGIKNMMNNIFKKGSFNKNRFLLASYDQYVMNRNDKMVLQFELGYFPKTNEEMARSQFFITKSLMPKYKIISPSALPIEQTFNQQPVYLKKDLIHASSKSMWVQRYRKVKDGEIPVKKTENKNKNYTELFLYEQTEEFRIEIDEQTGDFKTDPQYKSLDIPPQYVPDAKFIIIHNNKLGNILFKNKIRHAKTIQGFCPMMFKILPNYIGYTIFRQDQKRVQQLWQQRKAYQDLNRKKRKYEELMGIWTQLFNKIQLQQLRNNMYNY